MNTGYSTTEDPPLQNHMSCKMCAFVGQNLVKHYVEGHPGAEIPVCLTPKELNNLKSNAMTPGQQPIETSAQDDKLDVIINFLRNLGPSSSFDKPLTCPLCTYNSTLKADIVSHLLIHGTSNLRCYFCLVTETNFNDLRDHVSIHTGEYAYQCIHCKFRGASFSDVSQHISQNHPRKEAKTIFENIFNPDRCLKGYVCSTCGYIQMNRSSVARHVSSVDLFCRGSHVIEFDISNGRKGVSSASIVKGNYSVSAPDSSDYVVSSSEAQTVGRNDSTTRVENMGQNRVYIQDEIEIAPSDSNVDSVSEKTSSIQTYNSSAGSMLVNLPIYRNVNRTGNESTSLRTENEAIKKPLTFTCALCQFSTLEGDQFVTHHKTDHRSDMSVWCKTCGKCFNNPNSLVTHVKDTICVKEDMIYRCGVKECKFDTSCGPTFVHHLKNFHKGSPLIFCVQCQKIFTLPHCLILHMQNECPSKEKHRRYPGQPPATTPSMSKPIEMNVPMKPTYTPQPVKPPVVIKSNTENKAKILKPPVTGKKRGRGRGKVSESDTRGRGRGKVKTALYSSESDTDDPSWAPTDPPSLRRSSRGVRKFEASDDEENSESKRHQGSFTCSCCPFSGKSNAVLEDHFLTVHKKAGVLGCNVCNLKFENTKNFLEHFELHGDAAK